MAAPQLTLKPDEAFFILLKAREFDEEADRSDSDPDAGEDTDQGIADGAAGWETLAELAGALRSLNDDARLDLIALIWIGRGDFALSEWSDARHAAADIGRGRFVRYVTGIPVVSDYLDEAFSQVGWSFEQYMEAV
jgi:hypothetical protein